jgi:hypothetical protein
MDLYKVHAFVLFKRMKKTLLEINHHCREMFQEPNGNLLLLVCNTDSGV